MEDNIEVLPPLQSEPAIDTDVRWKGRAARFVTSQMVSMLGSAMVRYSIVWLITLRTGSGVMMMISVLCSFLPQLVVSFFAGTWADKYNRKTLIIIADLMIAAASLLLGGLMFFGFEDLWLYFLVSAFGSLCQGIQSPAVSAFTTQIIPKNKLMQVNGMSSSLSSFVMLLAPVLSGIIMTAGGLWPIFAIDVVTALTAICIIGFIRAPEAVKNGEEEEATFIGGIRYIVKNKFIQDMIVFLGIMMFLITPAAMLSPLQVTRTFGDEVIYLTGLEIAFSVGTIVGGVLVGFIVKRFKKQAIAALATFILGLLTASLSVLDFNFFVYCIPMLLTGFFVPLFNVPLVTLFQENVRPDMMGRVFGFVSLVNSCMFPIGMLLFGPLADLIDIRILMLVTGLLQSLLVIFALKGRWNKLPPVNANIS